MDDDAKTPMHDAIGQRPEPKDLEAEGLGDSGLSVLGDNRSDGDDPAQAPLADMTTGSAGGSGNASQSIKDGASKLARQATDKARDYAQEGKARAGGALDEVSRLMGDAANTVDEKIGVQYGQYARTAAEGIAGFSESLKSKDIDDLVADATAFVRKSPAIAIGVAAALGFVVARLVKAGLDGADVATDADGTPPSAGI